MSGLDRRAALLGSGALALTAALPRDARAQGYVPPVAPPPIVPGKPLRVCEYGNSFTARGIAAGSPPASALQTSVNGLSPMLEAMSGGLVRIDNPLTQMKGNNGWSSTQLANGFAVQVGSLLPAVDAVVIWGWAQNDPQNSIPAATTFANIQAIYAQVYGAGKLLILGYPYFPRSGTYALTAAQEAVAGQVARTVGLWARSVPGIVYADYWNDVVAAAQTGSAGAATVQDTDGLHPASFGVQVVARRVLASLVPYLAGAWQPTGQLDIYDATNNPTGNLFSTLATGGALFQGTGGTFSAGTSGQIPTGWAAYRSAGTDPITYTKIAAASGYSSAGGDLVTVGVSNPAANCAAVMQAYPACPAALVGKQVEMLLDVMMPATANGLADFTVSILPQYNFGSTWGLRADALPATYWIGGQRYVVRTPPLTVPAGTSTFQVQVSTAFLAGATAAFTLGRPVLRQVAA